MFLRRRLSATRTNRHSGTYVYLHYGVFLADNLIQGDLQMCFEVSRNKYIVILVYYMNYGFDLKAV